MVNINPDPTPEQLFLTIGNDAASSYCVMKLIMTPPADQGAYMRMEIVGETSSHSFQIDSIRDMEAFHAAVGNLIEVSKHWRSKK